VDNKLSRDEYAYFSSHIDRILDVHILIIVAHGNRLVKRGDKKLNDDRGDGRR